MESLRTFLDTDDAAQPPNLTLDNICIELIDHYDAERSTSGESPESDATAEAVSGEETTGAPGDDSVADEALRRAIETLAERDRRRALQQLLRDLEVGVETAMEPEHGAGFPHQLGERGDPVLQRRETRHQHTRRGMSQ